MSGKMEPDRAKRPVIVTDFQYDFGAPSIDHRPFKGQIQIGLEPRDSIAPFSAKFGTQKSWGEMIDPKAMFVGKFVDLSATKHIDGMNMKGQLDLFGSGFAVLPRPVKRFLSPEHAGYPLRRMLFVTFNRELGLVTADLRETASIFPIKGIGSDEESAFSDLERRFDQLVREKVRIPPHAQQEEDDPIRKLVNHMVDWEQFDKENPKPRLLVGRVREIGIPLTPIIHWLSGPLGIQNVAAPLPWNYRSVYFNPLRPGDWFQGVALEFSDIVQWIEPPAKCPDPTAEANRRQAWEAIPRTHANDQDAWPMKAT